MTLLKSYYKSSLFPNFFIPNLHLNEIVIYSDKLYLLSMASTPFSAKNYLTSKEIYTLYIQYLS